MPGMMLRAGGLVFLALLLGGGAVLGGPTGETFRLESAELGPFPREIPLNGSITFTVRARRGHHSPVLAVTKPSGETEYHHADRAPAAGKYEFDVGFKAGPGPYRVELVLDSSRGDTTAAQFTVWAGVKRPATPSEGDLARPETDFEAERPDEHPLRLERDLFHRMNEYRKSIGKKPYPWLEQVAVAGRTHLVDYLALKPRPPKFTHQIPGKGAIADRMKADFAWPRTIPKFAVDDPKIGPEADCYVSESFGAPASLEWFFTEVCLREAAFRAPVVSEHPTHAAVAVVREPGGKRPYLAMIHVQVNSTRVRDELERNLVDLVRLEAKAATPEAQAEALRRLARYAGGGEVALFRRRAGDREIAVRAAALDGLFLLDPAAAAEIVEAGSRTVARAHDRDRYGPALPVLETWAALEWDAAARTRGKAELGRLTKAAEAELDAAMKLSFAGDAAAAEAALRAVADKYAGLPAARMAAARLSPEKE